MAKKKVDGISFSLLLSLLICVCVGGNKATTTTEKTGQSIEANFNNNKKKRKRANVKFFEQIYSIELSCQLILYNHDFILIEIKKFGLNYRFYDYYYLIVFLFIQRFEAVSSFHFYLSNFPND